MPRGDRRCARRATSAPAGELQVFALAPDALAQDRKIENFDAHGARSLPARDARVSRQPTGKSRNFGRARISYSQG